MVRAQAKYVFSQFLTLGLTACLLPLDSFSQGDWFRPLREVPLPPAHAVAAELKFLQNHVVLIHRGPTREPGPTDHSVAVLDGGGREVFARAPGLDIPDVRMINLLDATLTTDGILIVSAAVWSTRSQVASVLMLYDISSGQLIRMVRTNPVGCPYIAADERGAIWCLGLHIDKHNAGQNDFDIAYKYALSGLLLGSFFPRSDFPDRSPPSSPTNAAFPKLVAHEGKISAWLPGINLLLEWTPDGKVSRRANLPSWSTPRGAGEEVTFLPGGKFVALLFVSAPDAERGSWRRGFFEFDESTTSWLPTAKPLRTLGLDYWLVGTDGPNIVLWDRYERKLVWHGLSN